jgi:hypothetical protein
MSTTPSAGSPIRPGIPEGSCASLKPRPHSAACAWAGRFDSLPAMLFTIFGTLISAFRSQRALAIENLALRHQLAVLQRTANRPRLRMADRMLWILLSRFWSCWRESLTIVRPETVIRWHREGFRLYWRWRSLDRPADRRGVPLGHGPKVPTTRSRWNLWDRVRPSGRLRGNRAGADLGALSLAEPVHRASDRVDSAGMLGSRDHLQRAASPMRTPRLSRVLPRIAHPSRIGEVLPGSSGDSAVWVGARFKESMAGGLHHRYYRRAA